MPATQAFCPAGTTIAFASTGTLPTDKTIGEVVSIEKTGQKRNTDDASNLSSPQNYKEFIKTMKEGGDLTVNYNFVPGDAGQVAVSAAFENDVLGAIPWQIVLPNSLGTFDFLAIIEEYGNYKFTTDKKASDALKLKVSGPVTFTP